ncbi:ribulose bisphosphate carboxylase small subunit [Tolypothrix sp. VBCCA 56010]|uniref:ribulose bisphosphate carboxylase small subunit n=1 Tax=Tolypothrix sp. VBCCA 56010 TaxID=3137731 RepID=UPI003D7ECCE6
MGYYIAPRFLDKLAVHITKNFLNIPGVRVPVILGIHGRKGEGKTFQCELVFEKMGIEVTLISGGELESPDAGDPARLIRLRYRETAELIKVRGKMCVLMINDLDAGAGRFDEGTQYTVNTQLVNATLMNIADNPTDVQLPGSYDSTPLNRVPIIVTGNDFSTLYAPLIRDGRMEKFYWEPDRDDKVGIVGGIFESDGLSQRDVEKLVDTFIKQSIDFFSALRSRIYDEQIRNFIHQIGFERISRRIVNSAEKPPEFQKPNFSLSHLIEIGNFMVSEQKRVENSQLVDEYNRLNRGRNNQPAPTSAVKPASQPSRNSSNEPAKTNGFNQQQTSSTHLTLETQQEIRNILSQGYKIGIEHVDERRFRTGSWQSFAVPQIDAESDAISTLEFFLAEHANEYVRLVGIDPQSKRRVLETIIQRPNRTGSTAPSLDITPLNQPLSNRTIQPAPFSNKLNQQQTSSTHLTLETQQEIRNILSQGYKIGIEHVDERRFRTGSWQTFAVPQIDAESDAISTLEFFLAEHANEYVRLVGIDPQSKRRVLETIIQRPNGKGSTNYQAAPSLNITPLNQPLSNRTIQPAPFSNKFNQQQTSSTHLTLETQGQVRRMLSQGYKIGIEHVDEKGFRTDSWQSFTVPQIDGESDPISTLEFFLAEHPNEYVRLVGIEPIGKRRVTETIIQRADVNTSNTNYQSAPSLGITPPNQPFNNPVTQPVPSNTFNKQQAASTHLTLETQQEIRNILSQGYKIGIEHVDERRFRTGSWQTFAVPQIDAESDAISTLEFFLAEHSNEYVRLVGIEPNGKRRVVETIIQRPNGKAS